MAEEVIDEARALELIRWLENFLGADWIDDQLSLRAKQSAAFGTWSPLSARNVPKLDRRIPYVKPRDFGTIQ